MYHSHYSFTFLLRELVLYHGNRHTVSIRCVSFGQSTRKTKKKVGIVANREIALLASGNLVIESNEPFENKT